MTNSGAKAYDGIVVGVGTMGSAACYHLAKRGARVLGLEKFDIPHVQGSSSGFSRAIRCSYHEHPDYVPLVRSAFSLWKDLEAESGQKLMHVTGALYMGPLDGSPVGGALVSARKYNLPFELLDRGELGRRFPQFRVPENYFGMLEQDAGFLLPEKAVAAHALQALRVGAELHGRESVTGWSSDEAGATVVTDRATYHAGHILFCGGAWTDQLIRDLGVPLRVTRQVLTWVWPKVPGLFELGRIPVWTIDHLDGTTHYGFPMMPDNPGLKVAHHFPGKSTDPDAVERSPLPGDEEDIRAVLQKTIPDGDGPFLSLRVCLYHLQPGSPFHHRSTSPAPAGPPGLRLQRPRV